MGKQDLHEYQKLFMKLYKSFETYQFKSQLK